MARETCIFGQEYYDATSGCNLASYANNSALSADQNLINSWYNDLLRLYGKNVDYYIHSYQTSASESNVYGEQASAPFWGPYEVKMIIQMNDASVILGTFGYSMDSEMTAVITFDAFDSVFVPLSAHAQLNQEVEPKAGDRIHLREFGLDRKGRRQGSWFEITDVTDESSDINQLGGHYAWKLSLKRLKDAYEPYKDGTKVPAHREDQVSDSKAIGVLSGGAVPTENPPTPDTRAGMDIDKVSQDFVHPSIAPKDFKYGEY